MTALEAGIPPEDIFLDPITLPINAAFKQQENVIEGIRQLALVNDPPPHFIIGLSNVSTEVPDEQTPEPHVSGDVPDRGTGCGDRGFRRSDLIDAMITAEVFGSILYSDDYVKAWRMQKGLQTG